MQASISITYLNLPVIYLEMLRPKLKHKMIHLKAGLVQIAISGAIGFSDPTKPSS